MAGFTDRKGPLTQGNSIKKILKDLSNLGMVYDDMVIRNSRAVGEIEAKLGYGYVNPMGSDSDDLYAMFASLSMSDMSSKKSISYFDKDYVRKRDQLRKFAAQDEIEDILDIIADEAIVYDTSNFFAYSNYDGEVSKDIRDEINTIYHEIYYYFGFTNSIQAWTYFRKLLIDGYLSFEIIYNTEQSKIIGFKELDPSSLMPAVDDNGKKIWIQYKDDPVKQKKLYDSQIIYIAYSQINETQRISYVERLIRSYNLLRIMESTRIIWAVTNSSFKTQFTIPVGGKSKTRAKQNLSMLMASYREQIDFNFDSGEISTNGKPMLPFNKEYWLPMKDNEKPEIETIGGDGPDLSDTEVLNYFSDKLKLTSLIPFNRFAREDSSYTINADGFLREEIKFGKFIDRLRSIFQEILIKPMYIQLVLNNPQIGSDIYFRSKLGIKFNKENIFEELKQIELQTKRSNFIGTMIQDISVQDENGNDVPYFDLDFLVRKYSGFTQADLILNENAKIKTKLTKDGYKPEDIAKIILGEDKSKFTPMTPPKDTEATKDKW